MKYFILILLFLPLISFGQAKQTDVHGTITIYSSSGTNPYSISFVFSDQTGQYIASDIADGMIVWDGKGDRYSLSSVTVSGTVSATATPLNATASLPQMGNGFVTQESDYCQLSLFVPDNNAGISQILKSQIESHNALQIDDCIQALAASVGVKVCEEQTITGTTFTVTGTLPADELDIQVYVNGLRQSTAYYTRTNATTITFGWTLNSDEVKICY